VEFWDLLAIEAPDGTRDPVVLKSEEDARAVLIRIGAGQELGDHQVKEVAWIVVVDGTVRVREGGRELDGRAGSLFRFDPNERHAIGSEAGARVLLLLSPWPGAGHYRGQEKAASRST
jgi:quercetin dioxygenase-like cupin family protein